MRRSSWAEFKVVVLVVVLLLVRLIGRGLLEVIVMVLVGVRCVLWWSFGWILDFLQLFCTTCVPILKTDILKNTTPVSGI